VGLHRQDYFAQTTTGTVCYFGEDVQIFENGGVSTPGSWRADARGNQPGIYMPANFNPLDGSRGTKVYAQGVGLIADGPLRLLSVTGL
jgi:hypothetical protein